jgi:hypothetical protein
MVSDAAHPAPDQEQDASPADDADDADDVRPRRHRVAFAVTMVVVIAVLAMLPVALVSMIDAMSGQSSERVYDLFSGAEVDPDELLAPDTTFLNVTVSDLDESSRTATLIVSGHRVCDEMCPPITATFFSLASDAARRRGLPPSAAMTAPGESGTYTTTIQLPIHGTPQRHPFDDYTLLLGVIFQAQLPDNPEQIIQSRELVQSRVSLTLENQVSRLSMAPPEPVDPETVRSPSDPVSFLLVDRLVWTRPIYLRIISIILVVLISASGVFALGMRTVSELLLGIGGIILGIWGVRSVVVQTPLPDVTLIDLVLALVILIMLLALSLRVARHFFLRSGMRLRRR